MVLTDRQRTDLHSGIYEYLLSRPGEAFRKAAEALRDADPESCNLTNGTSGSPSSASAASASKASKTPLLEKKWTAIPRLQKKVLELERVVAQSAKIHAHRIGTSSSGGEGEDGGGGPGGGRRMLPRLPCSHKLQGHSMVVTSVAVHPVFTVAVSGSEDGTVKIWDFESGEFMRTLKGHTNTVNAVSFSPKGTHLATCSTDLSIKLWDFKTYSCLRTLRGHDHTISAVRFLPLPSVLSSAATSPTAGSISSNPLSSPGGGPSATTGIDSTAAGCKHLLSASRDMTVKMWDVETGFCDNTLSDHTDWVRCLAVRQSDGGLFASSGNDQTIFVYDSSNQHHQTKVAELRGHEHVVESLAFVTEEPLSKNKNTKRETKQTELVRDYLASGSRDRTVRLWRISEASCIAVFKAHENWVRSVLIHPSGNYVLSAADDKTIRVFDVKANRCLRTLEKAHDHFVTSLDMHHALPYMVSGSVDQTIRCWQLD